MAKAETEHVPSVSERLGIKPFYPDTKRVEFRALLDTSFRIEDAMIIPNYESEYGTHDLALIAISVDNEFVTTACSGMVVVKKIRQLIELGAFPTTAVLTKTGNYYDLK